MERDRWLSHAEAPCLIAACPQHLAALVRFALATGCRAREIAGLEWNRVDLTRNTAWLNHTKNGTPRGGALNQDAVEVLLEQVRMHPRHRFTYRGRCITWELSNLAWHTALAKAGIRGYTWGHGIVRWGRLAMN